MVAVNHDRLRIPIFTKSTAHQTAFEFEDYELQTLRSMIDRGASATGAKEVASTNLGHWRTPGYIFILLGVVALTQSHSVAYDEFWEPGVLMIANGLVLLPAVWRAIKRGTQQALADHFLVLASAFLAYFVFGALLVPFGPKDLADNVLSYYSVDASLAMRVTAFNSIGCGLALACGSLIRWNRLAEWTRRAIFAGREISRELVIAAFLLVGSLSFFYVFAADFGVLSGEAVPGILRTMSQLLLVAIMAAASHRGRGSVVLIVLAILLTAIQAMAGLATLNKSGVILPLIALMTGLAWRLGIRRVIVLGLAVILIVLNLIGDPVARARRTTELDSEINWTERIDIMSDSMLRSRDSQPNDEYSVWERFCYLAAQGAAIDLYDAGQGGDDIALLGWVMVPRFLFPDKPIITRGTEFNEKIAGSASSASVHGVFIDGYYNSGWWGVILVGIAVGCILACTSTIAAEIYRAKALIWLPIALLGNVMAFHVDGSFVGDYWGPFVFIGFALIAGMTLSPKRRT